MSLAQLGFDVPVVLEGSDGGSVEEPFTAVGAPPVDPFPGFRVTPKIWRRRSVGIHGYVGLNGAGKSAAMIRDTIPSLRKGRRVLSTVPILDPATGEPHPLYDPFTDWAQLINAKSCDVLMDEMTGIAGARQAMSMPVEVQAILDKLRKADLVVRWSAPDWSRADSIMRDNTQAVTYCDGYLSKRTDKRSHDGEARLWPPKRLFRLRTYDPREASDFTPSGLRRMRALSVEWWYGPGSIVFNTYDTSAPVTRVGMVLDSGRCIHCGGRREIPKCSCH